jgi:nucleoside-diphosphate-sugar epimerase
VGWGNDISIKELTKMIAEKVQFECVIQWDTCKLDGMLRKCLGNTLMINLGFEPKISLDDGGKSLALKMSLKLNILFMTLVIIFVPLK